MMDKFGIMLSLLFFVICARVEGQITVRESPEADFIKNPNPSFYGVSKSEIIRMDLDVDESGKPVVFITWKGFGSKAGFTWTAYIPNTEGYTRFDDAQGSEGVIQFRQDMVYAGKFPEISPSGGLIVYYPGKGGKGPLIQYDVTSKGAKSRRVQNLDLQSKEDAALFEKLFGRKPSEPLGRKYFENPPFEVVSVDEIKKKAKIGVGRSGAEDSENKQAQKKVVEKEKLPESTFSKKPAVSDKKPIEPETVEPVSDNPFPYWIFIIGGVVVVGLVVLLRRK